MDYLTRRHENYQALVREGVMCGRLSIFDGRRPRWQLECTIVGDISKEEAKRSVENYCRKEWEATDFSYVTSIGAKAGTFRVRFTSWVL